MSPPHDPRSAAPPKGVSPAVWVSNVTEHDPRRLVQGLLAGFGVYVAVMSLTALVGSLGAVMPVFLLLFGYGSYLFAPLLLLFIYVGRLRGEAWARVEGDALVLQTRTKTARIARDTLREGSVKAWGASVMVQLLAERQRRYELVVPDPAAAEGLLRDLGLDGATRRATMRLSRRSARMMALGLGGTASLASLFALTVWLVVWRHPPDWAAAFFLLPLALSAGTLRALWARRDVEVVVGRDAVRARDAAGRWHEMPTARIDRALERDGGLVLVLDDGAEAVFPAPCDLAEERAALVARINDVVAERRTAGAGSLAALARNGRPLEAWREALASLLSQENYRHLAVSRDDLVAVLHDGTRSLEERAAAALAMVGNGQDARAVSQVRIAAESSANERVRIVLQEAAEGRVDEALLRDDAPRAPRARGDG